MASEIEIETEVTKTQEKDTGSNHVVPVMLAFYNTDRKSVKERSIYRYRVFQRARKCNECSQAYYWAPWVLGIWGVLVLIFRELGSTGNYFQGFGEQAHSFGD